MPVVEDSAYLRWHLGFCPCCGGEIDDYPLTDPPTEPETIGELVRICGRCAAMEHVRDPELRRAMLAAIALRDDAPINAILWPQGC